MKKFGIITLMALCVLGCKPKNEPVQEPQPVEFETPTWQVKSGDYATMTLIMALPSGIVCDTTDMIGVFTNDDSECLAVETPAVAGNSLLGFVVMVAPSADNNCYLKYYHKSTKHMYTTAPSALVYDTDALVGSLDEPKAFNWNIIKK